MTSNNSDHGSETVASTASGKEGALAVLVDGETVGGKPSRAASHLDGMAIVWSSLCALHCTLPLVLTGTALLSSTQHDHGHHDHGGLQLALAGVSVAVAGVLLGRSYVLQHRDSRPLWILAAAVSLLALGRFLPWSTESAAMASTSAGFLALVAAQVVNVLLLRRGRGTACCVRPRSAEKGVT
jgi:hypothetical protein